MVLVRKPIPEVSLFILLMRRKFPVVNCIRRLDELDCVAESDVFHDLFDHVPMLFNPLFANHLQACGASGIKAHDLGRLKNNHHAFVGTRPNLA